MSSWRLPFFASIYTGSVVKIAGKALGWHIAVNWRWHAGKDGAA
jgi:hypothetical protein